MNRTNLYICFYIFIFGFFIKSGLVGQDTFNISEIKGTDSLRVMTLNVRYKNDKDVGQYSWETRCPLICQMLIMFSPDIIGFQSVLPSQFEDIKKELKKLGYSWFGVSRSKDSVLKKFDVYNVLTKKLNLGSEGNYIFYNSKRLKCYESDTFWLNSSKKAFEKDWGAKYPRICTWGLFFDQYFQKKFYIFNTHLDHESFEARKNGMELIANTMLEKAENKIPAIIMGDFNSYGGDLDFCLTSFFKQPWNLFDAKYISSKPIENVSTFKDWSSQEGLILDHILINSKELFSVYKYTVLNRRDGKRLSDHFPVFIDFTFK